MRHFSTLLFAFIFMASVAFAWDNVRVQTSDGMEVNATNPLPVTFGTGNQTIAGNVYINGNLGLGSTSPTEKLDIAGNATLTGTLTAGALDIGGTSPTIDFGLYHEYIKNVVDGVIYLGGNGGTNNEEMSLDFEATNNEVKIASPSGAIFNINATTKVSSSGNVGIGTSVPSAKLEVIGTMKVTGSGNVGIGTTAPTAALDIGGGSRTFGTTSNSVLIKGNLEVDSAIYVGTGTVNNVTGAAGSVYIGGKLEVDGGIYPKDQVGQTQTITVRDSAGTGTCTIIFTDGVKTGGTCS